MNHSDFWQMVETAKDHSQNIEEQIKWLEQKARSFLDDELLDMAVVIDALFKAAFRFRLAYAFAYFAPAQAITEDGFEYNCGWLIMQGKEVFERVLQNPDDLADFESIGECENLWVLPHLIFSERYHRAIFPVAFEQPVMIDEPQNDEEFALFDTMAAKIFPRLSARFASALNM